METKGRERKGMQEKRRGVVRWEEEEHGDYCERNEDEKGSRNMRVLPTYGFKDGFPHGCKL